MLTPDGKSADTHDRIILLSRWAAKLKAEGLEINFAGMGKPTFPFNLHAKLNRGCFL